MLKDILKKIESMYFKQYILLLFSQGLNFGTALLNSILFTDMLTKEDYGLYKYGQNFLNLAAVIILLGIPYSASRLLVKSQKQEQEREIIGITVKIMFVLSALFSVALLILLLCMSFWGMSVNIALYYSLPAIFLIVLQQSNLAMLQGTGKAKSISIQTFLPPLFILLSLICVRAGFGGRIAFGGAWLIFCLAYLFTHLLTLHVTHASLLGWNKDIFKEIFREAKAGGKGVYIGSLIGVASGYCINFILGYVSGMANYAVYALAWSIAATMQAVPSVMGTVMYKRNAHEKEISKHNILLTIATSVIAFVCFVVVDYWMLPVLFSDNYDGLCWMTSVLGFAMILNGVGDFFNRFITANGYGNYIQKGALITGVSNVFFSFVLIWSLKIEGVIIARIIASLAYLCTMIFFYRKTVNKKKNTIYMEGTKG